MNRHVLPAFLKRRAGSPAGETFLVLASGGIDSSTLLWLSADQGLGPSAIFVDYGQPAADAERAAVTSVCNSIGAPLRRVLYRGSSFGPGEIRGRNAHLLHTAFMEFPTTSGVVALGIHAGTGYVDCSPKFVDVMQRSYDFHAGGEITVAAPFVNWTKEQVYALATQLKVPLAQTYSCEAGVQPCGNCRSCRDRDLLVTGLVKC